MASLASPSRINLKQTTITAGQIALLCLFAWGLPDFSQADPLSHSRQRHRSWCATAIISLQINSRDQR